MVNQKDLRFTIYDEFEQILSGVVADVNITDTMPHKPEEFPAVVHSYSVEELDMNRSMSAPTKTLRDNDGDATGQEHTTLHSAEFEITVAAQTKQDESTVHRLLKDYWQKYTKRAWEESDIHGDIFNIDVSNSNEVNVSDRFPKVYAHQFTLTVQFKRYQTKDVDPITDIDQTDSIET